jgi:ketosteroid isomerase-like protein
MRGLLVVGLGVLLVGSAAAVTRSSREADREALLKADRAFDDATATRGLDGFRSFLADDVSTLRPDKPVIQGKEAVAEAWRALLANPALAIRWAPISASVSSGGDLGYTIGSYEITRTDERGKRVAGSGKYVTIWRKQADGSWKVEFDSGVNDSPPEEKR